MRICILTQYFPPEMGAASARLSEIAKAFVRRGHEVIVLTAMPNYPTGKIFPGYSGIIRKETWDGISVIRTFIYPTKRAGIIPRILNYFSFVISSLLFGILTLRKVDFLLTQSPPLFLGISGYLLSRIKRARWIFNVSDLWPESAIRLGLVKDGWELRLAHFLEAFFYKKAWLVTGQSKEILQNILSRFPNTRAYHLSNGVDPNMFSPNLRSTAVREALAGKDACIAIYAGLLGVAQGLDQLIKAASKLEDLRNLVMIFVGDGREREQLIELSKQMKLANVRFLEACPREQLPALLASADIALIPLKTYIPGAVPSKLYEAMATGLPVILVAKGEAAEIVRETNSGIVVNPGDIDSLVTALRDLAIHPEKRKHLGLAGRKAALERFDRRIIAQQFIEMLEREL